MAGLDVSTRGYRGRVVVTLRGALDLAGAAGTVAALAGLAARGGEIIIDLAGLEFNRLPWPGRAGTCPRAGPAGRR